MSAENPHIEEIQVELALAKRELEIEAALERVRACSMAMQSSDEMLEISHVLSDQLGSLGLEVNSAHFILADEEGRQFALWNAPGSLHSRPEAVATTVHWIDWDGPLIDIHNEWIIRWKRGDAHHSYRIEPDRMVDWAMHFGGFAKEIGITPETALQLTPAGIFKDHVFIKYGAVGVSRTDRYITEAEMRLLCRFAKEFERTYTRFLDLKNAEEAAREAKIEAALERVRSRTMAMRHSGELQEVSQVVCNQFREAGIPLMSSYVVFGMADQPIQEMWFAASPDQLDKIGNESVEVHHISFSTDQPHLVKWQDDWESGKRDTSYYIPPDLFEWWLNHYASFTQAIGLTKEFLLQATPNGWHHTDNFTEFGSIGVVKEDPLTDFEKEILSRFAREFERSYKRFEDLKKAEAATREAQIEASLERVRSRAMAMQKSDELQDITQVVTQQLDQLDVNFFYVGLSMADEARDNFKIHLGISQSHPVVELRDKLGVWDYSFASYFHSTVEWEAAQNWDGVDDFRRADIAPEAFDDWFDAFEIIMFDLGLTKEILRPIYPAGVFAVQTLMGPGYMEIGGGQDFSAEEVQVLVRFTHEFRSAYTRFQDIQKAEEQAREAQLEVALERVRSAAMAMHQSDDFLEVAKVLWEQVESLGHEDVDFVGIQVDDRLRNKTVAYFKGNRAAAEGDKVEYGMVEQSLEKSWLARQVVGRADAGETSITVRLDGDHLREMIDELIWEPSRDGFRALGLDYYHYHQERYSGGCLDMGSLEEPNEATKSTLSRFAGAFDMAFTRYEDLKRAESDAREAKIEAALERVRAASMAMHKSEEISEVARVVSEQLKSLEFPHFNRAAISTKDPDPAYFRYHASSRDARYSFTMHRLSWELFKEAFPKFMEDHGGVKWPSDRRLIRYDYEQLPKLYQVLTEAGLSLDISEEENEVVQLFDYQSSFEGGVVHAVTHELLSEEYLSILDRFAAVFGMAFQRFEELMGAEARAATARKEASVDRIRGEISTMRTAKDLERITPLMWQELETLEIPFLRCGLLIADEMAQIVRFYPSHPDGRSLAAIQLPFGGAGIADEVLDAWRKRRAWKDVWDRERFVQWTTDMVAAGQIENPQDYYDGEEPPESIALHFVPFAQGMIYVGSPEPLENTQLDVVQSLADAFAVAYARYDDFQTTEKALTELKATQKQLVEQEKLASLGSLTAGIAHEIKNPLNFVNNFAEVTSELVDELNEAVASGNTDDVTSILKDLRGNTEQIAKHGKRADSIVRSMMQHAKGGSSEMETVDLNEFIEEYVNLAWHGMRAREHGFEAEVIRDYDEASGSLELKPQDIGRVVLNILNNAFQSVSKAGVADPVVAVSTARHNDSVEIHISDNGPGIPEDIREKIFEPFFTTKETGEGTGLGLSLSHDIVTKGHGGTLVVRSSDEGGAAFEITLPV